MLLLRIFYAAIVASLIVGPDHWRWWPLFAVVVFAATFVLARKGTRER